MKYLSVEMAGIFILLDSEQVVVADISKCKKCGYKVVSTLFIPDKEIQQEVREGKRAYFVLNTNKQ